VSSRTGTRASSIRHAHTTSPQDGTTACVRSEVVRASTRRGIAVQLRRSASVAPRYLRSVVETPRALAGRLSSCSADSWPRPRFARLESGLMVGCPSAPWKLGKRQSVLTNVERQSHRSEPHRKVGGGAAASGAKTYTIFQGTSEILHIVIASAVAHVPDESPLPTTEMAVPGR
jgi:hypothetical protein